MTDRPGELGFQTDDMDLGATAAKTASERKVMSLEAMCKREGISIKEVLCFAMSQPEENPSRS